MTNKETLKMLELAKIGLEAIELAPQLKKAFDMYEKLPNTNGKRVIAKLWSNHQTHKLLEQAYDVLQFDADSNISANSVAEAKILIRLAMDMISNE
jgi:hypothetical protein